MQGAAQDDKGRFLYWFAKEMGKQVQDLHGSSAPENHPCHLRYNLTVNDTNLRGCDLAHLTVFST